MLASTLIKRLQEQIDLHGDLPVHTGHSTDEKPVRSPVTKVDRIHGGEKFGRHSFFFSLSRWPDCIRIHCRGE